MTTEAEIDDFLEHFGVKGMRWGVRKANDTEDSSKSKLSPKTMRNLKIAAGVGVGAAVLVGGIFVRNYMSSSGGRTTIAEVARMAETNPGHAREAARIRSNMNLMNREIARDFRQVERTIDPRFIADPSAYRWPA